MPSPTIPSPVVSQPRVAQSFPAPAIPSRSTSSIFDKVPDSSIIRSATTIATTPVTIPLAAMSGFLKFILTAFSVAVSLGAEFLLPKDAKKAKGHVKDGVSFVQGYVNSMPGFFDSFGMIKQGVFGPDSTTSYVAPKAITTVPNKHKPVTEYIDPNDPRNIDDAANLGDPGPEGTEVRGPGNNLGPSHSPHDPSGGQAFCNDGQGLSQ